MEISLQETSCLHIQK